MLQKGHDIAMDTLATQITEAILSETFLNKDAIKPRVKALLKSYLKKADAPKHFNKKATHDTVANYMRTINKTNIEQQYWKDEVRGLCTQAEMQQHFIKLDQIVKASGA